MFSNKTHRQPSNMGQLMLDRNSAPSTPVAAPMTPMAQMGGPMGSVDMSQMTPLNVTSPQPQDGRHLSYDL